MLGTMVGLIGSGKIGVMAYFLPNNFDHFANPKYIMMRNGFLLIAFLVLVGPSSVRVVASVDSCWTLVGPGEYAAGVPPLVVNRSNAHVSANQLRDLDDEVEEPDETEDDTDTAARELLRESGSAFWGIVLENAIESLQPIANSTRMACVNGRPGDERSRFLSLCRLLI